MVLNDSVGDLARNVWLSEVAVYYPGSKDGQRGRSAGAGQPAQAFVPG
jgi:hypothetical protein